MRLPWVVALVMTASSAMAAKPKIAVLDVSTTGMEASLVPMLTEVLTVEVDALERFQVVAGSDVRTLLGFEKQKDLFGCSEASCLAEIGGALGVEKLVVCNIGRLGNTYVVNIKLIDIKKVETQGRVYETVQGEIDQLLQTIRNGVRRVFANVADGVPPEPLATRPEAPRAETPRAAPPRVAEAKPVAPAVREPAPAKPTAPLAEPPSTQLSGDHGRSWTVPLALWGAGAVSLGLGAYFGNAAKQHYDGATNPDQIGRQTEIAAGQRSQLFANVAFGVSAVAIGSGLGFWWFGGPRHGTVALIPTDGGAAVVSSFALDL